MLPRKPHWAQWALKASSDSPLNIWSLCEHFMWHSDYWSLFSDPDLKPPSGLKSLSGWNCHPDVAVISVAYFCAVLKINTVNHQLLLLIPEQSCLLGSMWSSDRWLPICFFHSHTKAWFTQAAIDLMFEEGSSENPVVAVFSWCFMFFYHSHFHSNPNSRADPSLRMFSLLELQLTYCPWCSHLMDFTASTPWQNPNHPSKLDLSNPQKLINWT